MALLSIKPLDGPGGYLRWKESMLLRVHTLGVARVLFEDPPTGGDNDEPAAAKKWARDDAICRGHILATLSDRLLPDYARHATARALWEAVARTYDVGTRWVWKDKFMEFRFDEGGHFLEQLAHAEALGISAKLSDDYLADQLCTRLPQVVWNGFVLQSGPDNQGMSLVWEIARRAVSRLEPELLWKTAQEMAGDYVEDVKQGEQKVCWNCGEPGHLARNCSVAADNNAKKCRRWA